MTIEPNDIIVDSSICALLQNSIVAASEFEVVTNVSAQLYSRIRTDFVFHQNELSNFFLHFSRDTYRIVQNSNNATIGKIVSEGLAFDFNTDAKILRARICMEAEVAGVDTTKYGVADVGLA